MREVFFAEFISKNFGLPYFHLRLVNIAYKYAKGHVS